MVSFGSANEFCAVVTVNAPGMLYLSYKAEEFQAAIIPRKIFGLEVILHIGTLRYEEHKTYEEIRVVLEGTIDFSSEIDISSIFTAEHAENAKAQERTIFIIGRR